MTNRSMERRLADAVNKTAPQNADGVLSRCQERKGTITVMTEKRLARRWMGLAAACLAVILLGGGGWLYREEHTAVSVVSLDVNPSIELKVNRKERVLSCTPMNGDAEEVLADMGNGEDLKGAKLEVAVNAIVGGFVRKGYLDKISSALMISVEDRNQTRANKLQRELTEMVDGILQSRELRVAVLTQTVPQFGTEQQFGFCRPGRAFYRRIEGSFQDGSAGNADRNGTGRSHCFRGIPEGNLGFSAALRGGCRAG